MTYRRLLDSVLADELSFMVARARTATSAPANRQLRRLGLRVRSYSVLALACSGLEPSQREIADFLLLDPSQVVSIIDDLEARSLIERSPSPGDRRIKVLRATDQGHDLFREAQEITSEVEARLVSRLSEEERRTLASLMRRVSYQD